MVLETWRPRNHPLITFKDSKECTSAACAIFAAFCAIYVRGAVVSRVVGKTATVATSGKTGEKAHGWNTRKTRFTPDQIQAAWDRLHRLGWLDGP